MLAVGSASVVVYYCNCSSAFCSPLTEPRHEKTWLLEFPTRSDSIWPAQLQKLA